MGEEVGGSSSVAREKGDWRQRMWESVMWCQGLEGVGMMRPELRQGWAERVRGWRERIEAKAARGGKDGDGDEVMGDADEGTHGDGLFVEESRNKVNPKGKSPLPFTLHQDFAYTSY